MCVWFFKRGILSLGLPYWRKSWKTNRKDKDLGDKAFREVKEQSKQKQQHVKMPHGQQKCLNSEQTCLHVVYVHKFPATFHKCQKSQVNTVNLIINCEEELIKT